MLYRLIAAIFLLTVALPARPSAQPGPLEVLSPVNGLSQGMVAQILQDRSGFLWFATKNGLNRYDGYRLVNFRHDPYDPYSLPHDEVFDLVEAGDGLLFVATAGGLALFDQRTQRFHRLGGSEAIFRTQTLLYTDGRRNVWALLGPAVFNRLYPLRLAANLGKRLQAGEPVDTLVRLDAALPGRAFRAAVDTTRDCLWSLFNDSLSCQAIDGSIRRAWTFPDGMGDTRKFGYLHFEPGGPGVWLSGDHALSRFDPASGRLQTWRVDLPSISFAIDPVYLWVFNKSGAYAFSRHELPAVFSAATAAFQLPVSLLRSTHTDRFGTMWVGTDGAGVFKFNPRNTAFRSFLPRHSLYAPLFVLPDSRIWINFIMVPPQSNQVFELQTGRLSAGLPWDDPEFKYERAASDDRGRIWLLGHRPGDRSRQGVLTRYDPQTGAKRHFFFTQNCVSYEGVLKFTAPDELWIALPGQIMVFNSAAGQFVVEHFPLSETPCETLYSLEKTAGETVWIATTQGLYRIDGRPSQGLRRTLITNNPASRNSLPYNTVKTLLTDPTDPAVLWIGTGGGLSRLDTRNNRFLHYNTRNGLPDNVVYGLLADALGYLWISTNKGITRLEPRSASFQYFYKSDGLQDDEFNTWAYGKMPDGRLLFGGVNGLTVFDPGNLLPRTDLPNVRITGIQINNRARTPRDTSKALPIAIEYATSITLPYQENNLTIEFSALDLTDPNRNRYRFYLEGAEDPWVHEGFDHSAQYLALKPGAYTFKVCGTNSDGQWNETPTTLHVVVRPPWYRTTLAWIIYLVLLVWSVVAFYRFQLRQKLEHAENERLKELNAAKTRLYTNITHEFRTPLTVILGMNDELRAHLSGQPAATDPLEATQAIGRHGQNLATLVNQILDLARLESGHLSVHPVIGDLVEFIRIVVESFRSFAAGKNIALYFEAAPGSREMTYDPDKVQMIVANLVSNALKFTAPGGMVWVAIDAAQPAGIVCTVRDNGPGIAADQLPRIFDRFYQANDSSTRPAEGTGIGLALVRELVRLMHGQITVESTVGQGTVFRIELPPLAAPGPDAPGISVAQPASARFWESPTPPTIPPESPYEQAPRLLIVEDNPDVRRYLAACTRDRYRIEFAENGREGIECALEHVPDLIVSDVMMPEKDGYELCDTLKNDERTSHIPIVLLTARADAASRLEGLRRSADDYIAKPFDRQELLARLDNLVRLRAQLRARYASLQSPEPTTDPDVGIEDAFVTRLRAFIETQFDNPDLSAEHLCRATGMSRSNLHLKMTALTGLSAMQYVRALRLDRAKALLTEGRLNVSEVAYAVGFEDAKYFSRVFSETFGLRPGQFRQK